MISAKVVADSKNEFGDRITTMLITMPRIILAEFNTHRMFSRNSASSRAIPFEKMVKSVEENPFIPIAWQKDHKGMQGVEYITDQLHIDECNRDWLEARDEALVYATRLNDGFLVNKEVQEDRVTKQICNRLLEPFMWHTVLVTSTEWENFFALRCPQYQNPLDLTGTIYRSRKDYIKDNSDAAVQYDDYLSWTMINKGQAEIHMMALAEAMWDAYNESIPKQLKAGEWHIPFEDKINMSILVPLIHGGLFDDGTIESRTDGYKMVLQAVLKISTAMVARTSYTVVGDEKEVSYEKLVEIHDKMINQVPFHASPFEHCAKAMSKHEYYKNVNGEFTNYVNNEISMTTISCNSKAPIFGWCRNFKGFIQYRHIIEERKRNNE